MRAGPEKNCRAKRNGIAPRAALAAAPNAHIPGARKRPPRGTAISIFSAGIRFPSGSYPEGDSDFGVADLVGNGWEWTRTPFAPFPGFQPFSFYPGYSANFFDGKHFVMKGGSPRTAACMLRRSFRNWFQPHYPYVYATFRCVEH